MQKAAESSTGGEIALSVSRLSKRFPGVQALTDVSLDLHVGEALGLVGENGAGKSTLIKIIAGVESADFRGHHSGQLNFSQVILWNCRDLPGTHDCSGHVRPVECISWRSTPQRTLAGSWFDGTSISRP